MFNRCSWFHFSLSKETGKYVWQTDWVGAAQVKLDNIAHRALWLDKLRSAPEKDQFSLQLFAEEYSCLARIAASMAEIKTHWHMLQIDICVYFLCPIVTGHFVWTTWTISIGFQARSPPIPTRWRPKFRSQSPDRHADGGASPKLPCFGDLLTQNPRAVRPPKSKIWYTKTIHSLGRPRLWKKSCTTGLPKPQISNWDTVYIRISALSRISAPLD